MGASPSTVDWKPNQQEVRVWSVAGVGLFVLGVAFFALPALIVNRSGSLRIGVIDVVTVLVITLLLAVFHEAVHAAVMTAFGGRPRFGVVLVAGSVPALFTTSPGHRFTRLQFLVVAAAPAVAISAIGLWATLATWGGYLIIPLAAHLAGCVGDGAAMSQVLRQPQGTLCEDLRDGIRFHVPPIEH